MFRPRRGTASVLAVCALIAAAGMATASSSLAPASVRIAGNMLPSLSRLSSAPAPANQMLSIGVALAHPNAAGENALLTRIYRPGSAQYGTYLSFDEVAARFAVPASRTAHVVASLRAAGLAVTAPDAMGDYVAATGTVAQVERAFGITERLFTLPNGVRFLANTTGPLVATADRVTTVVGLNTLQRYTLPSGHRKVAQDICAGGTCTGNTSPQDLWSVYGQPNTRNGQGVTMAVIGEGNPKNLFGYLAKQEDHFGLPRTKLSVRCVQGNCGNDTSGDGEWQIDTQASAGMAPRNAGVTLYLPSPFLTVT